MLYAANINGSPLVNYQRGEKRAIFIQRAFVLGWLDGLGPTARL